MSKKIPFLQMFAALLPVAGAGRRPLEGWVIAGRGH